MTDLPVSRQAPRIAVATRQRGARDLVNDERVRRLDWVLQVAVLTLAVIGALLVDRALVRAGIAPPGWMALRVPLSLGLGVLTLAAAAL